eukprot:7991716-Ditylum_brightwellii.AAC.1
MRQKQTAQIASNQRDDIPRVRALVTSSFQQTYNAILDRSALLCGQIASKDDLEDIVVVLGAKISA